MNVTDSSRASAATTFIVAGLAANVGLTLLSFGVSRLMPGSYEGVWPIINELFWLAATGVLVTGLLQLAGAVSDGTVLVVTAVVMIVNALIDLAVTVLLRKFFGFTQLVEDGSLLLSMFTRGLLIFTLVRLTMKTHAWVLPLLGLVAVFTVLRSALSVAMMHQLVDTELYRNPVYWFGMPLVSLFNVSAMLVGGLASRSAVAMASTPGVGTQALVAAAGLRPAEPERLSPATDFLVGGILLLVGLGVTFVSMEAASNGGRYVVATGAIGVGLGRIIRGLVRAGRNT